MALPGIGCSTNITDRDITAITASRTRELSDQRQIESDRILFVDTRNEAAFNEGHIPGARNMNLGDLEDSRTLNSMRQFNTIVVYGRNPGDPGASGFTKRLLAERRMGRVLHFAGGIESWQRAGYPVNRIE